MTTALRYTLEEVENIIFNGFDYQIPDEVIAKISNLAIQVGSPDYVKTPVFKKRENPLKSSSSELVAEQSINGDLKQHKRRGNKNVEMVNDSDWDALRTFQTTKIETKVGLDAEFDNIRAVINKLTDKNYVEQRNKIVEIIDRLVSDNLDADLSSIGTNIFDIASSNRYYSKIYADLYAYLSNRFEFIKTKYEDNFKKFMDLFNNIEYVDPNENYDKFCEINKTNEKRKSLATFYMNLMFLGIIQKNEISVIMCNLLTKIYEFISIDDKKNEVEELTETIAILYKKDLYEKDEDNTIEGYTINEIVEKIANSKVKDYKSLSNKSLFKFMDLIEM